MIANKSVETVVDDVKFFDDAEKNAVGNLKIFENAAKSAAKDAAKGVDENVDSSEIFERIDEDTDSLKISENVDENE